MAAGDALGQRIRRFLEAESLTQADLAARIGVSQSGLSHIVKGRRGTTLPRLDALAREMRMTVSDLFLDEEVRALQDTLTEEAIRVAHAFDQVDKRAKQLVRLALRMDEQEQTTTARSSGEPARTRAPTGKAQSEPEFSHRAGARRTRRAR